jgi:hypothetical protein
MITFIKVSGSGNGNSVNIFWKKGTCGLQGDGEPMRYLRLQVSPSLAPVFGQRGLKKERKRHEFFPELFSWAVLVLFRTL